jgi:hypothetical protein
MKKLFLIAGFAILLIFMFSQIHEITHYEIGRGFGCKGTIVWDFLDVNKVITETFNGEQTAFMSTHWDSNCLRTEAHAQMQAMNEIIGYNIIPLLELILIMFFTYIIIGPPIIINLKKKKKGNITVVDNK